MKAPRRPAARPEPGRRRSRPSWALLALLAPACEGYGGAAFADGADGPASSLASVTGGGAFGAVRTGRGSDGGSSASGGVFGLRQVNRGAAEITAGSRGGRNLGGAAAAHPFATGRDDGVLQIAATANHILAAERIVGAGVGGSGEFGARAAALSASGAIGHVGLNRQRRSPEPGGKGAGDGDAVRRVAVTRESFEARLKDKSFRSWDRFREALGPDAELREKPTVGGAERLMSGLSVAFVIVINALMWSVIGYCVCILGHGRKSVWAALCFIEVYAIFVYAYCLWAYQYPGLRLITNFLFGVVPLAVSAGSYVAALIILDAVRSLYRDGWMTEILSRLNPWDEDLFGRVIFFLAVLPGLSTSIYLSSTVSTGFHSNATHFDVLSLCLFVDIGRFCGHLSYVIDRDWTIGRSRSDVRTRPGLLYIVLFVCLGWYAVLARVEAGADGGPILKDRTKIITLCALTSYTFFPTAMYYASSLVNDHFKGTPRGGPVETLAFIGAALPVATFMLLVGVVFDALEANVMGILTLLWVVFFGAVMLSFGANGGCCSFILVLALISAAVYCVVMLSSQYAAVIRAAVLGALGP